MVQSNDKLQSMENFASYLANLPQTPLVEAVTALYESVNNSQTVFKTLEELRDYLDRAAYGTFENR